MKKGIILIVLICSILIYDHVDAVTITQEVQKMESTIITQSDNAWIDTWGKYKKELTSNEDIVYNPLKLTQDGGVLAGRDFVEIPILFNAPAGYVNQESGLEVVCTQWTASGSSYYCSNWSSQSNGQPVYIQGSFNEFNMFIVMEMTDSTTSACTIQNTNIVCPLGKKKPRELRIYTNYRANTLGKLFVFIDRTWIYYNTVSNQDIINNQNQNTQTIIESNNTYDYNATQDYTNQTNEMDNITNAEDTLMNNLDFNTTDMNITINPNASTFIWNIVDSLRLMSTKIVLLMTSILSLGIIKLVLNR